MLSCRGTRVDGKVVDLSLVVQDDLVKDVS